MAAPSNPGDITILLRRVQDGDREAEKSLVSAVYNELHRMAARYMRRERMGHTLQTTALVNEAYLKLVNQKEANWQNRSHFFAVAAQVMRRILVDYARNRLAEKRGGGQEALPLEEGLVFTPERCAQLVALDAALERLEVQDKRVSKVVELRFFSGLSVDETAEALKISTRTVKRDWNFGRAWLRAELQSGAGHGPQPLGAN
jgi:RNA polymerase sigma factor (TIGR02999 family)